MSPRPVTDLWAPEECHRKLTSGLHIYRHIHTHTHIPLHSNTLECTLTHFCVCTHTYTHTQTEAHIYTYTHTHTLECTLTHFCVRTHTHTHTHTLKCTLIHLYTSVCGCAQMLPQRDPQGRSVNQFAMSAWEDSWLFSHIWAATFLSCPRVLLKVSYHP